MYGQGIIDFFNDFLFLFINVVKILKKKITRHNLRKKLKYILQNDRSEI